MALTVEDGSVVSSANTYVTVDYVDSYCDDLGLSDWEDLTETEKEQAILRAMSFIESQSFKGVKTDVDNALKWPREGVYDEDGYAIDDDTIPDRLKKAVARAAYEECLDANCLQQNIDKGVKREKIDILETEYFISDSLPTTTYQAVNNYLKPYVKSSNQVSIVRC